MKRLLLRYRQKDLMEMGLARTGPESMTTQREDQASSVGVVALDTKSFLLTLPDGRRRHVHYHVRGDHVTMTWGGQSYTFEVHDADKLLALAGGASGKKGVQSIASSMPGLVVKVLVQVGDRVEARQPVIIVEAMKMENILAAEAPGVVTAIHAKPGDNIEGGKELVRIEAKDEEDKPREHTDPAETTNGVAGITEG